MLTFSDKGDVYWIVSLILSLIISRLGMAGGGHIFCNSQGPEFSVFAWF